MTPLFDDAPFIAVVRPPVRPPRGLCRARRPFPARRRRRRPAGAAPCRRRSARPRRCASACSTSATDKYGLNAWIFDSTNDSTTNYDKVLFSRTKSAADARRRPSPRASSPTSRSRSVGGALDGKTAGMLVKVEELTARPLAASACSTRPSAARSRPGRRGPASPASRGDFAEYLAQTFPTSTAADFAILEAGVTSARRPTSSRASTGPPATSRCSSTSSTPTTRTSCSPACPTTDEFQHQFLGLVLAEAARTARRTRPTTTSTSNGVADGRVAAREASSATAYKEADETLTLARGLAGRQPDDVRRRPTTASRRSSSPSTPASRSSTSACCSKPQTSNCRTADGRDDRQGQGLLGRRRLQIYLNVVGPRSASGERASRRSRRPTSTATRRRRSRAAYHGLVDPNDWTHDGQPEGWKVIDRDLHQGRGPLHPERRRTSTADMAHPTRTGDLVVFAYPPYQFDAETPGTLIAPSHFFGQHGYVPDVQDLAREHQHAGDVPRRRPGHRQGPASTRADDRPRADARLHPRHPRAAAEPGPGPDSTIAQGRQLDQADLDRRPQRLPRPARPDDARRSTTHQRPASAARRTSPRCSTRSSRRLPGPGLLLAGRRQRRRLAAELGAARGHADDRRRERVGPRRHVATATTSSTTASTRLQRSSARAHFPFLATNIVETATGQRSRRGSQPSNVFTVNGIKVGVIGAELQSTPELVSAGATAGPDVPRRGRRASRPSRSGCKPQGVNVQVVVIHQGTNDGAATRSATPPACRGTARSSASPTRSRTRRSTR